MQGSYTFNYLKIYLWHGISILLNLVSMFIVIPRLTNNASTYGIYVVCISANIFLVYADIGFAGAGYKYASEHYAQNRLKEEIEIVGFVGFVLSLFVLLFVIGIAFVAIKPEILFKNLNNPSDLRIASNLLFILAAFSPTIVLQRMLDIIYGARLEQFVQQRIMIVASVLKILSVLYFFRAAHYEIVGYFLFCQAMTLAANVFCLVLARARYGYAFSVLLRAFRFSKQVFERTRTLAFGSLFITITWILYYEIDAFAIARLIGVESVAIYAVGFTILSFLRTGLGVLYSPFNARFNHFMALKDLDGLRIMYLDVLTLTLPLVVFPIVSLILLMKPFVNALAGNRYEQSVLVARLLILGFVGAFITNPTSVLIVAQERMRAIYITSAILPVVYWTGILLTIRYFGVNSFALFKCVTLFVGGLMSFAIAIRFMEIQVGNFFRSVIGPALVPLAVLILSLAYVGQFLRLEKKPLHVLFVVLVGGIASAIATGLYYLFSRKFRSYTHGFLRRCFAY
jgi:O-antigen/teichoic acid export membrane protein